MPANTRSKFTKHCTDLRSLLQKVKEENRKVIYLDEVNFTKRSISLKEWSQKNSNLTID